MSRITSFLYCESIQPEMTQQGPKPHMIGPLLNLNLQFVPGTFSFAVGMALKGVPIGASYVLRYNFLSPSNDILVDSGDIQLNFTLNPEEGHIPEEERGVFINFDFRNVVFRNEGLYKSTVLLDGVNLGEFPIAVYGRERL